MKTETIILTVVLAVLLGLLGLHIVTTDGLPGSQYTEVVDTIQVYRPADAEWSREQRAWVALDTEQPVDPTVVAPARTWEIERSVQRQRRAEPGVEIDLLSTFGLWFAALCTLFVLSFLYRDNVLYKFAEALVVGVSAAYAMVVAFWNDLIPKLIGQLAPDFVQAHFAPELAAKQNLWYLIPLILGIMLLWRLAPKGAWIARWPLAFIIGFTAGMRLLAYLQGDFVVQIQATIIPLLLIDDGSFEFWYSMRNIAIVLGVLACLTYFFFSIEHKGAVGKTAKVGIWVLMITFGAGFAYTVMGRITLLTRRIDFLFDDWLWLIQ